MNATIREMKEHEYPLLLDFLYEAIFQPGPGPKVSRTILQKPELMVYINEFGKKPSDYCFCAEVNGVIIGAVWVRIIQGYGHVDSATPEFAISLYEEYRGYGIGTELMKRMIRHLKECGYRKTSLAVQKENYAFKMYRKVGFEIVAENEEEYIMECKLN